MILFLACFLLFVTGIIFIAYAFIFIDMCITDIPFVRTDPKLFPLIIKHMNLTDHSIVYDLGCGDGLLLKAISKQYPKVQVRGIGRGLIPYIFGRIRTYYTPVKITYGNYMNTSLLDATHIYCYISTKIMEKFAVKFTNECKPGTRIVACCFPIPGWKAYDIIKYKSSNGLNQDLYFYQTPL